jgi:ribonucleoside-diphosphate reductase subunit M1
LSFSLTFAFPLFADSAKAANSKAVTPSPAPTPVAAAPKVNGSSSIRDITNGVSRTSISSPAAKPTPTPVSVLEPTPAVKKEGDDEDISYEEAVRRREERELEEAKMLCSIENKEACLSKFFFFFASSSMQ